MPPAPPQSPLSKLVQSNPQWLFDAFAREGMGRDDVVNHLVEFDVTDGYFVKAKFVRYIGDCLSEHTMTFAFTPDERAQFAQYLRELSDERKRRNRLELIDLLATGDGQVWSDFWDNAEQQRIGETMYGKQADVILASSWLAKQKSRGWR